MLLAWVFRVDHLEFLGPDHRAVTPGQAHGLATRLVDQADDVLLHLASQHPFDHLHGLGVGHAHALDELALLAQAVQRVLDLRAAAVHHHRIDAHQLEQHHILGEVGLQFGVGHGVAAVFDDHGLAVELADVGQRLGQDFGFFARRDGTGVGHGRGSRRREKTGLCNMAATRPTRRVPAVRSGALRHTHARRSSAPA